MEDCMIVGIDLSNKNDVVSTLTVARVRTDQSMEIVNYLKKKKIRKEIQNDRK